MCWPCPGDNGAARCSRPVNRGSQPRTHAPSESVDVHHRHDTDGDAGTDAGAHNSADSLTFSQANPHAFHDSRRVPTAQRIGPHRVRATPAG